MDFLVDGIKNGFWQTIADLISDALKEITSWIIDMLVNMSDVDKYFDTKVYLPYVYSVAAALLLISIAMQALKYQTGVGNEKSISELTFRTIAAGVGIYFLPWLLKNVFIELNNLVMQLINSVGQMVTADTVKNALTVNLSNLGGFQILLFLVFAICWLVMGISAGKRFAELVIAILISPIIATSLIKGNEGVETWFNEVISIVFTQSIHIILLKMLIQVALNTTGLTCIALTVGTVMVALSGPKVLKNYLYTSGVGGGAMNAAGGGARMVAMKTMMKASVPA